MTIANFGYAVLQMTDPAAWQNFGVEILGMEAVDAPGGGDAKALKMDDHPFRYLIVKGDEERYFASGLDCRDKAGFDAQIESLTAAGHEITTGSADDAALRAVTEYATVSDPSGNALELYHGRIMDGKGFSGNDKVDGFMTGPMGLGHAVLPAPNIEETHKFYTQLLGFGDCDDLNLPPPAEGAPPQRIMFMHADNPRHHSLALYNFPHPAGVVHIMAEVGTHDEVGRAHDRATTAGIPVIASLGRHVNDNMFSFYMMGPGGIAVEYGCDGRQCDWSTFTPTVSTEGDIWGHEYNFPEPAE